MKHLIYGFVFLAIVLVAVAVPPVLADAPTGSGPNDPLSADGTTWRTVAPNTTQWYYFDYMGDKSTVEVDLDDNATPNVQLAIISPGIAQQFAADQTTPPVAWATTPQSWTQSGKHDLVWLGGFVVPGRYYAVVVNKNSRPVSVRMAMSGLTVVFSPTPAPTPPLALPNPFFTPVPTGSIQGHLVFEVSPGGDIYTVNGDGSQLKKITYGIDPAFSPNGKQIAFTRWNDPAGLFTINADGSQEKQVYRVDRAISPTWSPDGSRILFTRQLGGQGDINRCNNGRCITVTGDLHWKLGVLDLATGALTQPKCSNHCFSATWMPDNRTVLYADAQIGLLGADTDPNGPPAWTIWSDNPEIQSTSLSPDGKRVVFMVRQNDHWEINVMNADGSSVVQVTQPDPLSWTVVNNAAPTWSPDGKQILFLSDRDGKWQFYAVNPDGTGMKQVLKNVTDSIKLDYQFNSERMADWIQ